MNNIPVTISIPNQNTYSGLYQKALFEKVSDTLYFYGTLRKVKDVRITDEKIYIDLGEPITEVQ